RRLPRASQKKARGYEDDENRQASEKKGGPSAFCDGSRLRSDGRFLFGKGRSRRRESRADAGRRLLNLGIAQDRAQVEGEVPSGLQALLGILFEAAPQQATQSGRHLLSGLRNVGRILVQDRRQGFRRRRPRKGPASRQHLVEHAAERKNVASGV